MLGRLTLAGTIVILTGDAFHPVSNQLYNRYSLPYLLACPGRGVLREALEGVLYQIERSYGRGSILKLGKQVPHFLSSTA